MSEVNIEAVAKNTEAILKIVGKQSFVNWEQFTENSSDVARHIDGLNQAVSLFRQTQHKNFIQTMKKLKNYDLPDILQAVQNKKLPKQALRGVLGRFKFNGDTLELNDSVETLRDNAKKQYAEYSNKNKEICQELQKFTEFINKKVEQSGFVPQKVPEFQKIQSTIKFNISEDQASKLASGIELQYLPNTKNLIGLKTYTQLLDKTFQLIKNQYKVLTTDSRKKQRQNMENHQQYLSLIRDYLNNSEALITEGQSLIATKLGVSEEKLGQSELLLMERGLGNNLLMLQSQLRAKIKQSLKSEKDVSTDVAKEILGYQVQMIDKKSEEINSIFKNMDKGPETVQIIPMLLALILNDYVYKKYGYEQEDFMKNLEESIMTNPDFIKIFREMESGIMKLMQKLEVIPPQVAEMMKQQQQMMEKMGGMMPPGMNPQMMGGQGMGMPGLMPGMGQSSNPMDMLQNQQMQQMQQMFMNMKPPQ